jgi:N-acetylglucosamine-6-phosphate deacetylase
MRFVLGGARVLTTAGFAEGRAVVVAGGRIEAVVPASEIPAGVPVRDLGGGILVPGFVDVQVNGGGGVLLNEDPTPRGVRAIAAAHRRYGTTGMLPTVITDAPEVMRAAAEAIAQALREGAPGVLGIHVEGPFIDIRRKGAHPPQRVRPLGEDDLTWLSGLDCGVVLLTVSPCDVPPEMIRRLVRAGIVVSLGHSEATDAQALAALEAGASGFTHLFNAMSQLGHRSPGMVGAALSSPGAYAGLIADGFHVDDTALKVALAAKPHDRLVLVTDAMPPAAGGPDAFALQGREAMRRDGKLVLADGTLAGSTLTMDEAVRFAVERLGVALPEALAMASANPAAWIGLGGELGRIEAGYRASLVHLGDDLTVHATWIDEQEENGGRHG